MTKLPVKSSKEEKDEGLEVRDEKGVLSTAVQPSASVTFVEERVASTESERELPGSAHLSTAVCSEGSESDAPKEQKSFVPVVNEAFQTSDGSAVKDRRDPLPSENTVVLPSDAPGLPTLVAPTSTGSVSRNGTPAKELELQKDLSPSERKFDSSVLSSDEETKCEQNPVSEVIGAVSSPEVSDLISVPSEVIGHSKDAESLNAEENDNFLKSSNNRRQLDLQARVPFRSPSPWNQWLSTLTRVNLMVGAVLFQRYGVVVGLHICRS